MQSDQIFSRLWKDYTSQNPDVQRVYDLFVRQGEEVVNDHIAFRTFDDPRVNVEVLSKVFVRSGYRPAGNYYFENKHLNARHFERSGDPDAPKVFISELLTRDFSPRLQQVVKQTVDAIPEKLLDSMDLIFSGNTWGIPSYQVYEALRKESEYAAWVYVFGFRANHFTVLVNKLKKYDTIQKVNQLLKDAGFVVNDAGGEIQGTPEELLEQSSIKAGIVRMKFSEGEFEIPSCYYEFARRYPDLDGKLYPGFIAKSADKIFQSTDFYRK